MKSTGIVRRTDKLGRIVLPVELRRSLGIEENGSLEICTDEDRIILKLYKPGCEVTPKMIGSIIGTLKRQGYGGAAKAVEQYVTEQGMILSEAP